MKVRILSIANFLFIFSCQNVVYRIEHKSVHVDTFLTLELVLYGDNK